MKNRKFKILLVEDEQIIQVATTLILDVKFGCEVSIAGSGEEALQMLSKNKYDLIFMDLGLPGINGIETTIEIKQSNGLNSKTSIVAFTAHTGEATRQRCFDAGMNEFLAKPFGSDELEKIIAKFIA